MIKNALLGALVVLAACDRGREPVGYQGVVELDERTLGFEVPGRVITLTKARGDKVAAGEVVATLDDAQPKASIAVREAEARVAGERAKLVAAGGRSEDINALEAQLRSARATEQLAIKHAAQDQTLVSQGALARAAADESETRRKAATAEREALEQQVRELRRGARAEELAGARAQESAAKAVVGLEQDRASRFQLRSLHDGEVLDVHVEAGEVVGAGTPVLTIGDPAHPYVEVFVPQGELAGVQVGAKATIRVDALAQPLHGTVEHVARRTEFTPRYIFSRSERANLVVRVRVRIDDPQHVLHAGVPAFVSIAA